VDYEHVATSFAADSKAPEYLAVNPNGRIPALVDGDLKLFESMAINTYLAKRYAPGLLPDDPAGEARALQWSVWGISEIEPLQMQLVVQKMFTPEDKRDPAVTARASKGLARPLGVLNDTLAANEYLLGDSFTIADLNVAAVMDLLGMVKFDLSAWPNVERWLTTCHARKSYSRAKAVGT
jgi:glutathione S-transferase